MQMPEALDENIWLTHIFMITALSPVEFAEESFICNLKNIYYTKFKFMASVKFK